MYVHPWSLRIHTKSAVLSKKKTWNHYYNVDILIPSYKQPTPLTGQPPSPPPPVWNTSGTPLLSDLLQRSAHQRCRQRQLTLDYTALKLRSHWTSTFTALKWEVIGDRWNFSFKRWIDIVDHVNFFKVNHLTTSFDFLIDNLTCRFRKKYFKAIYRQCLF